MNLYLHFDMHQVLPVADSNFLVVGSIANDTNQAQNALLMKIDADGNLLWHRSYENTAYGAFHSTAVQTADSGYIMAWGGQNQGPGFSLIKLDIDGNLLWSKAYDNGLVVSVTDIEKISDSTYLLVGNYKESTGDYSGIFIPIDENGHVSPSQKYYQLYIDDLEWNGTQIAVCGKNHGYSNMFFAAMGNATGSLAMGIHPHQVAGSGNLDDYGQIIAITDTNYMFYSFGSDWSGIGFEIGTNATVYQKLTPDPIMADVMRTSDNGVLFMGSGPLIGIKTIYAQHTGIVRTDSTLQIPGCGLNSTTQPEALILPLPDTVIWAMSPTMPFETYQSIYEAVISLEDSATCVEFWGSVDELEQALDITVFPNISDGSFTFESESKASFDLRIVSTAGRIILESQNEVSGTTVDLSAFADGIYYYSATTEDGRNSKGKLVLRK